MTEVSVVIPCFNMGQYIDEAVQSVLAQTFQDFEIVIVDDGSTEEHTKSLLSSYHRPRTRVLHTANAGTAAARNAGVRASKGKYILPLDADDRIGTTYLAKAVAILNAHANIGIVYCEAELFGERYGKWQLEQYDLRRLLVSNMIFCSGLYRRADWEQTRGYDTALPGWEDHDFWLSIVELGRDVYRIPETLFYYRQRAGSRNTGIDHRRTVECMSMMFRSHRQLYETNIEAVFEELSHLRSEVTYLNTLLLTMEKSRTWRLRTRCVNRVRRIVAATQRWKRRVMERGA